MSNQIQVPYVKTSDDALNQVQQNVNKVLRNINNQLVLLQNTVVRLVRLGDIQLSGLNLAKFQAAAGSTWIAANGQSCVDSDYAAFSGNNVVPNISVTNANAYIKVNL